MNEIDKLIARLGWQLGQQDITIQQLTNRNKLLQDRIDELRKQQTATDVVEEQKNEG